jgi:hypothetical protein
VSKLWKYVTIVPHVSNCQLSDGHLAFWADWFRVVSKSLGNWDPQMLQTHRPRPMVWLFYVRPPITCRSRSHLLLWQKNISPFFFPSKLSNAIKSLKRIFLMRLEGHLYIHENCTPKKNGILHLVLKSENGGITPIRITRIA